MICMCIQALIIVLALRETRLMPLTGRTCIPHVIALKASLDRGMNEVLSVLRHRL